MTPHRLRLSALSAAQAARGVSPDSAKLSLQFLASLNHEIRTPLSGILGMVDLLKETQLDDEQRDFVQAVEQCAGSLFDLLNDTLEYTALASGAIRIEESEFHLEDTLRAAVDEFQSKAASRELRVAFHVPQDLPRTAIGDAYRVRQVLTLLLHHALRALESRPPAAQSVSLSVGGEYRPGRGFQLVLNVQTGGPGLTPEEVAAVFRTFDEIESGATRRFNGVGLGLALLRRLVRLLSGDLVFESEPPGSGGLTAEIPLRLPLPVIVPSDLRAGSPAPAAAPRILLVEDNRISQQVIAAILQKGAFEFDCVGDGPSAVAAAASSLYSLILMDLQMPGMDGLETADRIRALAGYQEIPILALTADTSDQIRSECRQRGMAAFINKPVQAAELLSSVRRHLSS
jgi:CheY-like chemotaxis protein